jgi:hypothetical protein
VEENQYKVNRGRQIVNELATIIRQLSDAEVGELLGNGPLNDLLISILDPTEISKHSNIAEFLLANKARVTLLALVRYAITHNYSFRGTKDGESRFVSPSHLQFFEDGITLLEGEKPFEGFITLYRDGRLRVAMSTRDAREGEHLGPDDFIFVELDEARKHIHQVSLKQIADLDEPVRELKALLKDQDNDEAKYQELLIKYPWVLGLIYKNIQRHQKLDDKNIPDFTGVRVHDDDRDLFELKPPFMKVFGKNGELLSNFYKAWDQAERYLDFVRRQRAYLLDKGLRFDHPNCYLILGYNLPKTTLEQVRLKQRGNPHIRLFTYNDLLKFMNSTIEFIKQFETANKPNQTASDNP